MSSSIVPRNSRAVESLPWRKAGGADAPWPSTDPDPAVDVETEKAALRQEVASLEASLEGAARVADERHGRAFEAGRQEGYSTGHRDGLATAQEASSGALAEVQAEAAERAAGAAVQAVDLRRRLRQQMEADLVKLAMAVARRILRRELAVDPEALMGIVKSAVERISARELLAIRVCPADGPRVSARLAELRLPERVDVVIDTALPWGSVVLETTRGQQDASVETQIEEIDRGLADLVGRPS